MSTIRIKRIYDPASEADGFRVLVDRVWPRGVSRDRGAIDHWAKEIAPSTALRRWFNHEPERWEDFRRRYRAELQIHAPALKDLLARSGDRPITLLFSARDREHNQAVVLKEVLSEM